ncbi:RNA-directed DNA polymerase, eukaryota [Tanacetum coccineum]
MNTKVKNENSMDEKVVLIGSRSAGSLQGVEIPRTGGSMVGLLEDSDKSWNRYMGFKMEESIANWKELNEHKREKKVSINGKNIMIIGGVYAPQEGKEKQALWDFLRFEVDKWNGDVIIMGDFNEVRVKSDRFGTHFNPHGAHRFNSFILDSGLVEVNLGGCRFTWCHRSATKMSKLDRFLVFGDVLLLESPEHKAVTIGEALVGSSAYLLKENGYDYGPTPFTFFPSWLKDGFNTCGEHLENSPYGGNNALLIWREIDLIFDRGLGNEELVNSRLAILHQIQKIDNLESKERAQKAKIKWAVEGDENSGFFHGLDFSYQISHEQSDPIGIGSKILSNGPHESYGKKATSWVQWEKALALKITVVRVRCLREKVLNLLFVHRRRNLGNGLSTLFWDDVWCDGASSERSPTAWNFDMFPNKMTPSLWKLIFAVTRQKEDFLNNKSWWYVLLWILTLTENGVLIDKEKTGEEELKACSKVAQSEREANKSSIQDEYLSTLNLQPLARKEKYQRSSTLKEPPEFKNELKIEEWLLLRCTIDGKTVPLSWGYGGGVDDSS